MNKRILFWCFVLCSMLGCGVWCLLSRQEIYYDLYNYHFYNGWAFIQGKTFSNHFVTGFYTFFNPLLDSLVYLLITKFNHYPNLVFFLTGLYHGLIYITIFLLFKLFISHKTLKEKFSFTCLLTYSVMGYALVRQLGTCTHEITIAIIFLLALYLFFKNIFVDKVESPRVLLLIGFLIGSAFGLKLTILPMCLGFGGVVLFCALTHQFKFPIKAMINLAIGGIIGLLITDGWWMYLTWEQTGNPLFPSLNNIFKSPLLPAESIRDLRFLPQNTLEALFYPFYWGWGTEYVTDSDVSVHNFHAMLPFLCAIWLTIQLILKRIKNPQEQALIIFYDLAYISWLWLFSILRYAVVLEALSGIIIFMTFKNLHLKSKFVISLSSLILIAALLCPMGYPTFSGVFSRRYIPDEILKVSDDTIVVVSEELSPIIAPFVQTKNPILGFMVSNIITEPIPFDSQTLQTYRDILSNKKVLIITNGLKISELFTEQEDLLKSSDENLTIYAITPDSWCGRFFVLAGFKDEKGLIHGFNMPIQNLDEFLRIMKAKRCAERHPEKKARGEL